MVRFDEAYEYYRNAWTEVFSKMAELQESDWHDPEIRHCHCDECHGDMLQSSECGPHCEPIIIGGRV